MQEQGDEEAEERDASREAQELDSYMLKKNVPPRGRLPRLTSPPTAPPASNTPDVRAIHIAR